MRLTRKQLRALIAEEAKRVSEATGDRGLDKDGKAASYVELANALASRLSDLMTDDVEGTVEDIVLHLGEDAFRPVRYEDVEDVAADVAEKAMPRIRDTVEAVAAAVLRDLMGAE